MTLKIKSKIFVAVSSTVLALATSACNPPMPPELQAQLADQYVSCESGDFNLIAAEELTTVADWVNQYNTICGANGVLQAPITDVENQEPIEINAEITNNLEPSLTCQIATSIPVALDGAVPVISLLDIDHLILSPDVLFEIFSGTITTWDDPKIVEQNPDSILPSTPIVIENKVHPAVLKSFVDWMAILDSSTWSAAPSSLVADPNALIETKIVTEPVDGTIGLYPYSFAANNVLALVSIKTDIEIDPDLESLASGATQLRFNDDSTLGMPIYDPSIEPIALQGDDLATTPWGAIFSTMLFTCKDATSTTTQAFARYVSRLEAQGTLVDLNLTGLGEPIRAQMLRLLGIGLASPAPIPDGIEFGEVEMPATEPTPMESS